MIAAHLAGTKMTERATPLHGTLGAVDAKPAQKAANCPVNIAGPSGGNEAVQAQNSHISEENIA